ncbi:MAG: hypothetical protein KatS3mg087_1372 [Patescibacteria group bacterium]|nr:MAG: hypothetical protein KatS3mg087_1372 [Patescibacteria group bacterium]
MFESGLKWLQEQRHKHMSVLVKLGTSLSTAVDLQATISFEEASSTASQITQQKQIHHFIFRTSDLKANNIKLHRGLKIWYDDREFETVYERNRLFEFNDPLGLDVIIKAVPVGLDI